jgi:nicotinamide-nucleotide amidase
MSLKAEIIGIGTELLLGQIVNTNARDISERLSSLGIDVLYHTAVGDNPGRIDAVFRTALQRSDLIITTGGLGPTLDDLTKERVAEVLGLPLELRAAELETLQSRFTRRGIEMPPNNIKQAMFPSGSLVIPNHNGTAPGVIVELGRQSIVILPGPPREIRPMLEETVLPYLARKAGDSPAVIKSRVLKLCGIGESAAEEVIRDILLAQSNPTIAPLAGSEMTFRITAKAGNAAAAREMIDAMEAKVRARLGKYIYGTDSDTLEEVVGRLLREKNLTLGLAESCTGGLIASRITAIAGCSDYFLSGVVSYSNTAKVEVLRVPATIIADYGAVSSETAKAMAHGIRQVSGAAIGLSVTGIAGPGGATPTKPLGLVYFGLATPENLQAEAHQFSGDRTTVRTRAAHQALVLLWNYLQK